MLTLPQFKSNSSHSSFAVLTSGGDAPGMNAAVRAVVRYALAHGRKISGISKGYSGLLEGNIFPMQASSVANIIQRGGTILKTDRCEAFHQKSTRKKAAEILLQNKVDALIVIGGDGSFTGASLLEKETGFPVMGVPGTIDNDIFGTDDTIGFDTSVNTAIEAIDRIRDTASSHDRIFLVEVMGRNSGFIALSTGIGGGAETVVIPEQKISMNSTKKIDEIRKTIDRGMKRGKSSSIIVVAEGQKPGLAERIAVELRRTGHHPRVCTLGHIQRGGTPTAHDRMLGSVLGASAVAYLMAGKSNAMVGVQGNEVALIPFSKCIGRSKPIPQGLIRLANILAI